MGPFPSALILVAWPGTLCAKAGLWPQFQLGVSRLGQGVAFRGVSGLSGRSGACRGPSGRIGTRDGCFRQRSQVLDVSDELCSLQCVRVTRIACRP